MPPAAEERESVLLSHYPSKVSPAAASPPRSSPGTPSVDVVISTFNEEAYVSRCLDAVIGQDYPAEAMRVWVIDGGSTDGTVALLRERAERDSRITVLADGRRRNLPEALNLAIPLGRGDLVAKVDAHGWPELDFLRRAADALAEDPRVACAGGRPVQEGETAFGRALAVARGSRMGVGGSEYAGRTERALVDTVQCGVYRRGPLVSVGSFDAGMNYGEDEEVNWRLRRAGHLIVLDTRICFHYVTRPSWGAAYRQYRNYGEARVRVVRKHPRFLRPHHLVPAAAVAGGAALAAAAPVSRLARRTLGAASGVYGTGVGLAAGRVARGDPALAGRVGSAFVALHAGYGVGVVRGLRSLAADRA